jgi:hypothetical protein
MVLLVLLGQAITFQLGFVPKDVFVLFFEIDDIFRRLQLCFLRLKLFLLFLILSLERVADFSCHPCCCSEFGSSNCYVGIQDWQKQS